MASVIFQIYFSLCFVLGGFVTYLDRIKAPKVLKVSARIIRQYLLKFSPSSPSFSYFAASLKSFAGHYLLV
jgi:hypothetical protein